MLQASELAAPPFDYAPSLESTAPAQLRERYGLFIGGEWVDAHDGKTFTTINPATEQALCEVAYGGAADVDQAVRAARRAFDKYWRKIRPSERAKYAYRIARALGERARELAIIETLDCGKPIRESRDFDVPQATAHFFYHAGWADKLAWALSGTQRARPLGVVGAIVPWNFPLLIAAWKIAPALACGNTVVLKPAPTTPLTALALASIIAEADLPPGVVNVVTGDDRTGAALVEHPDVDKLTFTGSTEVGKQIRRTVAGTKTKLSLELGGKSAIIVYDDAPLDQAVEGIVEAIYFNQGHVCCAGSRLLVQERIAHELCERLQERIDRLRLGDPLDKNTDIGAINSRAQRDRIAEFVRGGIEEGATLVQQRCTLPERGFFFPASFFTGVQPSARIAREEIFGPVLSVMTFRTAD
ncbi:MAG TPA: aldehyde dehydrogenase family protein, partial [Candidatus Acidoferrales bacterium]|nr:aldehyde dehydrogenase family protein [Candidatus Acidoferrales bacterium]